MIRLVFLMVLGGCLAVSGCVSETTSSALGEPPSPKPRRVSPAPQTAPINDIAMLKAMYPVDTNGNGYPNRLNVSVFLFARPYPVPRFANGTLVFSLYPPSAYDRREGFGADPIVEWRIDSQRMRGARFQNVVGQGYALSLDLAEFGITSLGYDSADLVTSFEPADGDLIVYGSSVQTITY